MSKKIDKTQIIKEYLQYSDTDQIHNGSYITIRQCVEMMEVLEQKLIDYIERDAEIAIPINELMHEDGRHRSKKEYGHILIQHLVKELRGFSS